MGETLIAFQLGGRMRRETGRSISNGNVARTFMETEENHPTLFLNLDDESVMGTFLGHVLEIGEHLAAKMREDEPLGPDFRPVLGDVRIIEMKAHRLLEEIALGDKEIGTLR
jgi:hypothetical protein